MFFIFFRYVIGVDIDLEEEATKGYPDSICRKCLTIISTFADFKKVFLGAQKKLKAERDEKVATSDIDMTTPHFDIAVQDDINFVRVEILSDEKSAEDSILPGKADIC